MSELRPSQSDMSFKKMLDSIFSQVSVDYSADELAVDNDKALHYLSSRSSDVTMFESSDFLKWEKVSIAEKKAELYNVGYVYQHVGWSNWGKFISTKTEGRLVVRFKTYECFVAWTLKNFWQ